ncbi:MAG: phosphatidate cytidylyltransferase [Pseudomonadota bacterium]
MTDMGWRIWPEIAWVVTMLIVLTLIVSALAERDGNDDLNPVVDNLLARLRGWWIMLGLLGLVLAVGPMAVVVLFVFVSMGALREFLTLTTRSKADHWAFVASFFVVLPVHYVTIGANWYGFYTVFIPVYAFLILPMLSVLRGRTDRFLSRVAETQWALMIAVYCLSHIPALLFLDITDFAGGNFLLMVFLVLVVQGGDVLQHFWSACAGRHPIAPIISQSRTWEGFGGGVISAGVLAVLLSWLTPFGIIGAFLIGCAIAGIGGMGRMVMMAIKQDRGVQDWGHMSDGQGGFVDRLDSIIFAAPVFFHLTRFFWQTMAG